MSTLVHLSMTPTCGRHKWMALSSQVFLYFNKAITWCVLCNYNEKQNPDLHIWWNTFFA